MKSMAFAGLLLVVAVAVSGLAVAQPAECEGMPLVFSEDFEKGSERWQMTDAGAWKVEEVEGNQVLALRRSSEYEPPVRSPESIAWIRGLKVTTFVLDAELKQTGKEYGHRDLCLFFGGTDPSHFYYVHLATTADAHANSVFLVNGEARVSIAKERTKGTDWGKGVHKVRIKRCTASGNIEVFFDDMEKPVMRAEDKTFLVGSIGLGSFDDVGHFDNVRVWGEALEACPGNANPKCVDEKPADGAETSSASGTK